MLIGKLGQELGCKDLVGVDISPNMIAIGKASEESHPLGIVYHVSDVLNLTKPEKKFDFVVAFYLLNYAKTINELDRMAQIIGEQLKDSDKGYFLSITWNMHFAEHIINSDIHLKHGYRCEAETPLFDGAPVKNTHLNPDGSLFSYITYYFSPSIYEQAFQKAGFKYFEWVPIAVARDSEKYEEALKYPASVGILAYK